MTHGRSRTRDHQLVAMNGSPVARLGAGRVCQDEACATVLSIYNRTTFCSLHTQPDRTKVNHVLWAR